MNDPTLIATATVPGPSSGPPAARVVLPAGHSHAEIYEAALQGVGLLFSDPESTREELEEGLTALVVAALDAATGTVTLDGNGRPIQPGPDRLRAVVQLELLRDPQKLRSMASTLRDRGCEALAASLEGRAARVLARRTLP